MTNAALISAEPGETADAPVARSRSLGIDVGRIIFVYAVIVLHSSSYVSESWGAILRIICHSGVPFFFIASGYFLRIPDKFSYTIFSKPFVRLFPIYLFWMILYYLFAYFMETAEIQFNVRALLSGGVAPPLWFLPALGFAMVLVPAGISLIGWPCTGLVCAGLALVSIGSGAYHDVLGLSGESKRGGLLVAPMFLFIGCVLARQRWRPSSLASACWMMLGFAILLGEEYFIASRLNRPLSSHDFAFGTFLFGTGAFLLARSLPEGPRLRWLAQLGLCAFGIYLSHLLFIWLFHDLEGGSPWAVFSLSALSFSCALLLTWLFRKIPYLKLAVT